MVMHFVDWFQAYGFNLRADVDQLNLVQDFYEPLNRVHSVWTDSPAGTGKTQLTVMAAYHILDQHIHNINKIIYIRAPFATVNLGFLPGTEKDKTEPFFAPLQEALDRIQPGLCEKLSRSDPKNKVFPQLFMRSTAFERGLTYENAFVIIDEAQNLTLLEFRTILTRITDNCKVAVIGSHRQVDNPKAYISKDFTAFEAYMNHFRTFPTARFHTLRRNYRGKFAQHADEIAI